MKYALMNNLCPACGSSLFGAKDIDLIKSVSSRVRSQLFAQSMSDILINDISMFIFKEYLSDSDEENIKNNLNTKDSDVDESKVISDNSDDDNQNEDGDSQNSENNLDEIRRQVRSEFLDEESSNTEPNKEDDDLRLERLKRLARDANSKGKSGTQVRRVK